MKTWIIALALVAGCASKPWVKATSTDADFKADQAECSAQAYADHPPDGTLTVLLVVKQAEKACLLRKGWREPS